MIRWEQDADGVVVLTMDDPNASVNTMSYAFGDVLGETIDRLEAERDTLTGVVVISAKKTFFAGANLEEIRAVTPDDAPQLSARLVRIKDQFRRLEKLGKPVVAAINGSALGAGLEIALACHRRIAADVSGSQLGFPEVTIGALPGLGGIIRTVRMVGIQNALLNFVLQGQRLKPAKALEVGLVDELVANVDDLLPKAKEWIAANSEPVQPWDKDGHRIPGGTPAQASFAANLPAFPANLRKQLKGANLPAPRAILAVAIEGAQVDFETAQTIESRYFVELLSGQVSTNMIKAFFFDLNHLNAGGSRPEGYEPYRAKKAGVLGAGMMGAAIAYVCARAGIDVVLKDVSLEAAERGKAYSVGLYDKAVSRGRSTQDEAAEGLARIVPTASADDLAGCDFVIEAVFENPELKHQVFGEIEPVVLPEAVLASNTSTLPITGLAEGVKRQEDFIGMHFFSPVEKMPLVEIIVGAQTSDATLAKTFDLARRLGKTPIVVNDSRGFFTSRVIGRFFDEAAAMVGEGLSPASIEQAGMQAGYPTPPLQLSDEVALSLLQKARRASRAAVEASGRTWEVHGAEVVHDRLVDEFGRPGRAGGAGFYEYVDGKRVGLWPGLASTFLNTSTDEGIPFEDMKDRLLFAEALDTIRCLAEGVLRSVPDANIGSIFGIGFPPWTGGAIQFVNGYPGGPAAFLARARELESRYGARFTPPGLLVEKAARNEVFE
ncbi:3-hydroxyacyl-CoA dehydrogenase NAD-binding domain-containing protein [Tenggerimyces flavus]|uniref:3-hydroxyacyl-CoA dehydrogenase NAD-binding domain-containing protein n=1 Tax=Tenggerimyces flavus TaxID=1708749 RepID=A0ABV7YKE0_9ACTN|nr:3-hydroxyacyl-CoA dehydrogenase NAD-binding domain-containing protein [Tenggerimyces flavus]MBM7789925.1 3-hydroxyacyl-CoA dehydrogenase/enoyl-CoA hydratase/3-hydroxybutyryl-CoA epimerase [Tenggerimyces flavus]